MTVELLVVGLVLLVLKGAAQAAGKAGWDYFASCRAAKKEQWFREMSAKTEKEKPPRKTRSGKKRKSKSKGDG